LFDTAYGGWCCGCTETCETVSKALNTGYPFGMAYEKQDSKSYAKNIETRAHPAMAFQNIGKALAGAKARKLGKHINPQNRL